MHVGRGIALLGALLAGTVASAAQAADPDPDAGFGSGGIVRSGADPINEFHAVSATADGGVIAGGYASAGRTHAAAGFVQRFTSAGAPVDGGSYLLAGGSGARVQAIHPTRAGDGYYVTGMHATVDGPRLFVMKLTLAGTPVTSGFTTFENGSVGTLGAAMSGFDVVEQADGKVIAVGSLNGSDDHVYAVALRLTTAGALDGTFAHEAGGIGHFRMGAQDAFARAALDTNGRLLVAGYTRSSQPVSRALVGRLLTAGDDAGTPDLTFNPTVDIKGFIPFFMGKQSADYSDLSGLVPDAAGGAYVGGRTDTTSGRLLEYGLARITPGGTLDTSFASGSEYPGTLALGSAIKSGSFTAVGLRMNAAGKLLMGGSNGGGLQFIRVNPDGTPDDTLNPTGQPKSVVKYDPPTGGDALVTAFDLTATGRPLLAGIDDDPNSTDEQGLIARFGGANTAPVPKIAISWNTTNMHPPRPGSLLTFDGTGSTGDGGIVTYEWTATENGVPHTGTGSTFSLYAPSEGTMTVQLRVTDANGIAATANDSVAIFNYQAPTVTAIQPVSAPVAGVDATFNVVATDPDGSIVSSAWSFPEAATKDVTVNGTTAKARWLGQGANRQVTVTVTDDEGQTSAPFTTKVNVAKAACIAPDTDVVKIWRAAFVNLGDDCFHKSSATKKQGTLITKQTLYETASQVRLNGLIIEPLTLGGGTASLKITQGQSVTGDTTSLTVKANLARVTGTLKNTPVVLYTGPLSWTIKENGQINGFKGSNDARMGGLKLDVGSARLDKSPAYVAPTATVELLPHLPQKFARDADTDGPTPDKPIKQKFGGLVSRSDADDKYCYGVDDVDFGVVAIDEAKLCYSPTKSGAHLWSMFGELTIRLLGADTPGEAGTAGAGIEFLEQATKGVQFHAAYLKANNLIKLGPVKIKRLEFQINVGPDFEETNLKGPYGATCVPVVGWVDLYTGNTMPNGKNGPVSSKHVIGGRKSMIDLLNLVAPNFKNGMGAGDYLKAEDPNGFFKSPNPKDFGTPDLAFCGGIGFNVISDEVGVFDANVGYADYPEGHPDVVWFTGTGDVAFHSVQAEAGGEVWTDGYTRFFAKAHGEIPFILNWNFGAEFEFYHTSWNADIYANVTVYPLFGAEFGAHVLASSKGLGVCLLAKAFGLDWSPGAGYIWDTKDLTLFFSGCDVERYRQKINHQSILGGNRSAPLLRSAGASPLAGNRALAGATADKITVPSGLPAAVFAIEGQNGIPRVTLTDNAGHSYDTGDLTGVVDTPEMMAVHHHNMTEVAIPKPVGGEWTITPAVDSVPVLKVSLADTLPDPKVKATVTGTGQDRELNVTIDGVADGEKVQLMEGDGSPGSAGQLLKVLDVKALRKAAAAKKPKAKAAAAGPAKLATVKQSIPFHPALGRPGSRPLRAIVYDDEGLPRRKISLGTYTAPSAPHPNKVRNLEMDHKSGDLIITWDPPANGDDGVTPDHYDVRIELSDGRVLRPPTTKRRIVVPDADDDLSAKVRISGVSARGIDGPQQLRNVKRIGKL